MSAVASIGKIPEPAAALLERARGGDKSATAELFEAWRRPLYGYIYRMVTHRQDTEDLLQDVVVRVLEGIRSYRGEAPFKSWLFGIATHVCLDHLRKKKRWRVEAQLIGEKEAQEQADGEMSKRMTALMAQPDFVFEIREHVAFCFSCIGRTLEPEEQAALMLREVLGFSSEEAAKIAGLSESTLRHRLSSAREKMISSFDGLCQLINKTGACWQCKGLREFSLAANRGADLVQIEVKPGVAVTAEHLFDARVEIVRTADLESGRTRTLHELFFKGISEREEKRG